MKITKSYLKQIIKEELEKINEIHKNYFHIIGNDPRPLKGFREKERGISITNMFKTREEALKVLNDINTNKNKYEFIPYDNYPRVGLDISYQK